MSELPRGRYLGFVYALLPFVGINVVLGLCTFYRVKVLEWPFVRVLMYPSWVKEIPPGQTFPTTLGNVNYSAGFGAVCAAVFLTLALLAPDARRRWLGVAATWCSFAIVVTSLSQSGFVTLVALLPLFALAAWRWGQGRATVLAGVAALAGCAVIYFALLGHNRTVWRESAGFFTLPDAPAASAPAGSGGGTSVPSELPVIAPKGRSFGSGRGYYWERTLELIAQRPLFGWGLDTIAYGFPQNHPEKLAGLGDVRHVVNKPHSLYLGIAYGAGVPALLAFLALVGVVLWGHLRAAWQGVRLDPVNVSLVLGCLAYLVQGLVNDSMIGYSAVFWVFLGASSNMLRAAQAAPAAPPVKLKRAN